MRAVTAVVAQPGIGAFQEPVTQAHLEQPDRAARERMLVIRQRADGGAVAAVEAGFGIDRAIVFDFVQQ